MDLPPNWELRECKDYPGQVYYYNSVTNESTWIRPVPFPGDKNTAEWPPMVYVLHILIKHNQSEHPNPALKRTREEAQNIINEIHQILLTDNKKFESIAKDRSDCESAKFNGVLGWIARKKMPPEFEKVAWGLGIGQISKPFETVEGFHIVLRRG
ncbi:PPIC-type PPIASE domain containing protein [Trichomonas vaginalis G3]|uniref:Peptidyl-prolyl cis-trans isomerase n=1 Tax=Trichomonas vaginalis (strain ATCC PRA-98 / G3) TaxID=412133 RepID=A2ED59_TRIV3|nr:positive regulation of chromatin silencing at rDNA [Trichomonas vaginalis G3]EAY09414.1 PPIC-type PPIASE domain containing protein [Trichomonas vaginalis G3]KAI5536335.1 positive regulation of chromatin silencing at rDNA [Trichomonas vaginalis G3]|eukprot:XP_001321637.1 PPIC-type PPIASE domain containing protein [Trichomonas vaginalis G3]